MRRQEDEAIVGTEAGERGRVDSRQREVGEERGEWGRVREWDGLSHSPLLSPLRHHHLSRPLSRPSSHSHTQNGEKERNMRG